jgi:hypothetical protein
MPRKINKGVSHKKRAVFGLPALPAPVVEARAGLIPESDWDDLEHELRHESIECAECDQLIEHEEEGESTYCGSMHIRCRATHNAHCGACQEG